MRARGAVGSLTQLTEFWQEATVAHSVICGLGTSSEHKLLAPEQAQRVRHRSGCPSWSVARWVRNLLRVCLLYRGTESLALSQVPSMYRQTVLWVLWARDEILLPFKAPNCLMYRDESRRMGDENLHVVRISKDRHKLLRSFYL